jgi:hypothetical protein
VTLATWTCGPHIITSILIVSNSVQSMFIVRSQSMTLTTRSKANKILHHPRTRCLCPRSFCYCSSSSEGSFAGTSAGTSAGAAVASCRCPFGHHRACLLNDSVDSVSSVEVYTPCMGAAVLLVPYVFLPRHQRTWRRSQGRSNTRCWCQARGLSDWWWFEVPHFNAPSVAVTAELRFPNHSTQWGDRRSRQLPSFSLSSQPRQMRPQKLLGRGV